jgi:hypothetical protein
VPFLLGLGLCVRAAWKARRATPGALPLALLAVLLMGNMSGNRIAFTPFWLVLAYALASQHMRAQVPQHLVASARTVGRERKGKLAEA